MNRLTAVCTAIAGSLWALSAGAALDIPDRPIGIGQLAQPMVMITMGRDHTLSYEAYNDATDIDNDGVLEAHERSYTPKREHLGLFDSYACYVYDNGTFKPQRNANATTKACGGASEWSGDFLNYLTTSRLDAIRKVLYGGTRVVDTANAATVVQGAYVPRDAHSWGKLYDPAIHGTGSSGPNALGAEYRFDIRQYTPFDGTGRIIFARTSQGMEAKDANHRLPIIRVWQNVDSTPNSFDATQLNVWNWVGQGRQDAIGAGSNADTDLWTAVSNSIIDVDNSTRIDISSKISQTYFIKAEVCSAHGSYSIDHLLSGTDPECKVYNNPNHARPVGILQRVGSLAEGDSGLNFGLLTGSYKHSLSGGVLRKAISHLGDEVDKDSGLFKASANGIISTIDKIRISRFGEKEGTGNVKRFTEYGACDLITEKSLVDHRAGGNEDCEDWGNPLAGMMYEVVRYFSGKKVPSPSYSADLTPGGTEKRTAGNLELPLASWDDPYRSDDKDEAQNRYCSPGYNLVISTNPTYDSTDVPGSKFAAESAAAADKGTDDINFGSKANDLMSKINSQVFGGSAKNIMVGEVDGVAAGNLAPTLKSASDLFGIRGLSPDDPTKYGSYYSALVAYFGNTTDLRKETNMPTDKQKVKTIAAGMASLLPKFKVTHDGDVITIVPFGKTTHAGNSGKPLNSDEGKFQPTMTITDYYIEEMTATSGKVRVNFEDIEQGYDHDMDAIVLYEYELIESGAPLIKHKHHTNTAYKDGVGGKPTVKVTVTPLFVAADLELHSGYVISGSHADGVYLEVAQTNSGNINPYYLDTLPTKMSIGDTNDIQDLPYPLNFRNQEDKQTPLAIPPSSCAVPENLPKDRLRVHVNIDGQKWGNEENLRLYTFEPERFGNFNSGGKLLIAPKKQAQTHNGVVAVDPDNFYYTFDEGITSANIILYNGGSGTGKQTANLKLNESRCFILKKGPWSDGYEGEAITQPPTRTKYFHFSGQQIFELESPLWYVGKYGWFDDLNGNGIADPGEWEEQGGDRDGLPKGYFQVTDGVSLRKGLSTAIKRIEDNNQSQLGGISFASGSVTKDGLMFEANYRPGYWDAEIIARDISGYDPDTNSPLLASPEVWRSTSTFSGIANNHGNRIVLSYNPVSKKGIRFMATQSNYFDDAYNENSTSFSNDQLNNLIAGFNNNSDSEKRDELKKRIDYWRGSKQHEGTSYRTRLLPIGDIIDSQPLLVGEDHGLTTPLLAVGANDGMLHLMNANNGSPLFAYIPSQVYGNLPELLDPYYSHKNFVNGQLVARKLGDSGPTLLVGALGAGGRGLYALDLTAVSSGVADSDTAAQNIVKWEFIPESNNGADVGYIFGKPVITRLKIGNADKWVVITHNGYNSDNNKAVLYVLDADNGSVLRKIEAALGSPTSPTNGLSEILVADVNQDGYGDLVYAGDLQGNMWGFDLTADSETNWGVMHQSGSGNAVPLFTATYQYNSSVFAQPITAAPSVARHPQGGSMVLFGTGKFIEGGDTFIPATPTAASPVNSFYAVRDEYIAEWDGVTPSELASKRKRTPVAGRTALLQQTFVTLDNTNLRLTSNTPVTYGGTNGVTGTNGKAGWYIDLLPDNKVTSFNGERQVSGSSIRFNKVLFTTIIPSGSACDGGGSSWLMEMDVYQGTSWYNPTIDTNGLSEAQEKQITNRRVEGLAGKTTTILAGPKQKEVDITPTSSKSTDGKAVLNQQVSDPNVIGRQSWIQLFMAPFTAPAATGP